MLFGIGIARVKAQSLRELDRSFFWPTERSEQAPQVVVRFGIIEVDLQGLLKFVEGLISRSGANERDGKVIVRFRVFRPKTNRFPVTRYGVGPFVIVRQGVAQIVVHLCGIGF